MTFVQQFIILTLGCKESLLKTINSILNLKLPTPAHPDLKTGISSEAVAHNSKILEENNFNLKQLIDKNMHTTMRYGSEFRPTEILEKLYGEHRYWKRVKRNIDMGVHYEVKKLPQKKA